MGIEAPSPLGRRRVAPSRSRGGEIEGRARLLVGVPFRLHGRSVETGLDCVGVVAAAHGVERVPRGYAVRTADAAGVARLLADHGFRKLEPRSRAEPGDVVLLNPGPAQCHLGVLTSAGFVHADAGIGRVVETPGAPSWPLLGLFRKG